MCFMGSKYCQKAQQFWSVLDCHAIHFKDQVLLEDFE